MADRPKIDQDHINVVLNLYLDNLIAEKKWKELHKYDRNVYTGRYMQGSYALDELDWKYFFAMAPYTIRDLKEDFKAGIKINIPRPEQNQLKPLTKEQKRLLRLSYWENLTAEKAFIDDQKGIRPIMHNPNYGYRTNMLRKVFKAWNYADGYQDMDQLIKKTHYHFTIDEIGANKYVQVDDKEHELKHPLLPDNVFREV